MAAFNPHNAADLNRLRNAIVWSRRKLLSFRRHYFNAVRQYVGSHYSDNGARDKVPINLLELAVSIYLQNLVAQNPQILVTTTQPGLRASAANLTPAGNQLLKEIDYENTQQAVVVEALFSPWGITKVGLEVGQAVDIGGSSYKGSQPFASSITLDHWVQDMMARDPRSFEFCGDQYRMRYDVVMESDLYEKKAREQLEGMTSPLTYMADPGEGGDRVKKIQAGSSVQPDEFTKHIDLWDQWLPNERMLVTFPVGAGPVLRTVKWDGPEDGPYHYLGFNKVSADLAMPVPPVGFWMDLHDLANRLFRKLGRQAERQKTILGVQRQAAADGSRIVASNDGDAIALDNPAGAKEYKFGGIDQVGLLFLTTLIDRFGYMAGNLDVMGGLSPMAETLGQEQLLAAGASKRLQSMQAKVVGNAKRVIEALLYYLLDDPLISMSLTRTIPGTNIQMPYTWTSNSQKGAFIEYNFDIVPYSMQYETPRQKLQSLANIFQTFVFPNLPSMEAQGRAVDIDKLLRIVAQYSNMPELQEIIISAPPIAQEPQMPGERVLGADRGRPRQSPVTKRTYERINRGGATRQGTDAALMKGLMNTANRQELALMGRPNR